MGENEELLIFPNLSISALTVNFRPFSKRWGYIRKGFTDWLYYFLKWMEQQTPLVIEVNVKRKFQKYVKEASDLEEIYIRRFIPLENCQKMKLILFR